MQRPEGWPGRFILCTALGTGTSTVGERKGPYNAKHRLSYAESGGTQRRPRLKSQDEGRNTPQRTFDARARVSAYGFDDHFTAAIQMAPLAFIRINASGTDILYSIYERGEQPCTGESDAVHQSENNNQTA